MFKKILVANWGEIACRVFRTAKKMAIMPNAGDNANAALSAKLGLTALEGEEPMRVCEAAE